MLQSLRPRASRSAGSTDNVHNCLVILKKYFRIIYIIFISGRVQRVVHLTDWLLKAVGSTSLFLSHSVQHGQIIPNPNFTNVQIEGKGRGMGRVHAAKRVLTITEYPENKYKSNAVLTKTLKLSS